MEPRLEETANGVRIAFSSDAGEPPYLSLDFEYIEQMRWGMTVTATARSNIPSVARLPDNVILMSRMVISKDQERRYFADRIGDLLIPPASGTPQDWRRHLEWAYILLNAHVMQPAPTVDISGHVVTEQRKFLVQDLLAEGKANILYGPGGTGKSVMALRLAAAVHQGRSVFGKSVGRQGRTLYLDWEDDLTTMVERSHFVAKGMGLKENIPVEYQSLHGRGPYERHHADVLLRVKADPTIKLVIFDSTAMAMHGSTSGDGAEGAIRFYSLVSQLPVTALLIDHVSSDDLKGGTGSAKPYGSVFKVNSARNVWEVRPWDTNEGVTLVHRKTNVAKRAHDIHVNVAWGTDSVTFEEQPDTWFPD